MSVLLLMLGILIALCSIAIHIFRAGKTADIVTNVIQCLSFSLVLSLVSILILGNPESVLHLIGY